jgi:hypothetical protein
MPETYQPYFRLDPLMGFFPSELCSSGAGKNCFQHLYPLDVQEKEMPKPVLEITDASTCYQVHRGKFKSKTFIFRVFLHT